MATVRDDIEGLGSAAIGIGPAAEFQARALVAQGYPFELYLDPQRTSFLALGIGKQTLARFLFDGRAWMRYLRALIRVRRQGKITGRYSHIPGVAIVNRASEPVYVYRGTGIGDYPPLSDVLQALRTVAAA